MALDQKVLDELKEKLLSEKARLEKELGRFATPTGTEGNYETNFPEDIGSRSDENATEVEEYTDKLAVEKNLEDQLHDILDGLKKMDAGTYGTDEKTGEPIDIERLRVYPGARTSIA